MTSRRLGRLWSGGGYLFQRLPVAALSRDRRDAGFFCQRSGLRARSIAFDSQAIPSRRSLSHRSGVNRIDPEIAFSPWGSFGLPLARGFVSFFMCLW